MAKRFQLSYAPFVAVMAVVVLLMALPSISAQDNKSPGPSTSAQDNKSPVPSSPGSSSDEEFFRKSCSVTPYPDVCNNMVPMVSPSKVKQNPFEMVKSVIEFSRLTSMSSALLFEDLGVHVQIPGEKKELNPSTEPKNLLEVVKGCSNSFVIVMHLKSQAIKQMDELNNPTSSANSKAEMKNVEKWLYDAIKEEGKCLASIMKKFNEALVNINLETKITSNALTLAKDFAANH